MCGIVYAKNKEGFNVTKKVIDTYKNQKSRGSDGFGFIANINGKAKIYRAETEEEILKMLKSIKTSEVLFHHRFPTSTINVVEATHPILVDNDKLKNKYYVVHNGVLKNQRELKKKHEAMGYVYNTIIEERTVYVAKATGQEYFEDSTLEKFNDSESLAIEIAEHIENGTGINTEGSVAYMAFVCDKNDNIIELVYGRNLGNPLTITDNKHVRVISSLGGASIQEHIMYRDTRDLSFVGKMKNVFTKKENLSQEELYVGVKPVHTEPIYTPYAPKFGYTKDKDDAEYDYHFDREEYFHGEWWVYTVTAYKNGTEKKVVNWNDTVELRIKKKKEESLSRGAQLSLPFVQNLSRTDEDILKEVAKLEEEICDLEGDLDSEVESLREYGYNEVEVSQYFPELNKKIEIKTNLVESLMEEFETIPDEKRKYSKHFATAYRKYCEENNDF